MWNRFLTENVAAEQVVILAALGCTKNQTLLTVLPTEDFLTEIIDSKT